MMGQSLQELEIQLEQSKAELQTSKEMVTQVEEELVPQLNQELADKKAETGPYREISCMLLQRLIELWPRERG